MTRSQVFLLVTVFAALIGVLAWREYATHSRLTELSSCVEKIRSELVASREQSADRADVQSLRDSAEAQRALLERILTVESAKAPPSLAEIRAGKPEVDKPAVESALSSAEPTGRVPALAFLSEHEVLSRFGNPSVTLANGNVVTWIYKLEGFERLLRVEFVNGRVLAAYDR